MHIFVNGMFDWLARVVGLALAGMMALSLFTLRVLRHVSSDIHDRHGNEAVTGLGMARTSGEETR